MYIDSAVDYEDLYEIVKSMYNASSSGKKSICIERVYSNQHCYIKNIQCIKELLEDNFRDSVIVNIESTEYKYKWQVKATITISWSW